MECVCPVGAIVPCEPQNFWMGSKMGTIERTYTTQQFSWILQNGHVNFVNPWKLSQMHTNPKMH
jgi:hypothetical protein